MEFLTGVGLDSGLLVSFEVDGCGESLDVCERGWALGNVDFDFFVDSGIGCLKFHFFSQFGSSGKISCFMLKRKFYTIFKKSIFCFQRLKKQYLNGLLDWYRLSAFSGCTFEVVASPLDPLLSLFCCTVCASPEEPTFLNLAGFSALPLDCVRFFLNHKYLYSFEKKQWVFSFRKLSNSSETHLEDSSTFRNESGRTVQKKNS